MQGFYVDTCIYLNLWKKERGLIFGKPLWLIAKHFFDKIINQNSTVYYSGFILKELSYRLEKEEFENKRKFIESSSNFLRITLKGNEYVEARDIEQKLGYSISFFDIIHMLISRKTNSVLITRDKKLLKIAKEFGVLAKKPEEVY